MKKCKVEGCNNKYRCSEYCSKHYRQYKKHGYVLERTIYDPNEFITYDDHFDIVLYNKCGLEVGRTMVSIMHLDRCINHKWFLDDGYVKTKIDGKIVRLHNFITNIRNVDHKDQNKLNNLDDNLRPCTNVENVQNRNVIGVSFRHNKWIARITVNGNRIYLGGFDNYNEALMARHDAEKKYFGEFAPDRSK